LSSDDLQFLVSYFLFENADFYQNGTKKQTHSKNESVSMI